jgi:hypothetical protein
MLGDFLKHIGIGNKKVEQYIKTDPPKAKTPPKARPNRVDISKDETITRGSDGRLYRNKYDDEAATSERTLLGKRVLNQTDMRLPYLTNFEVDMLTGDNGREVYTYGKLTPLQLAKAKQIKVWWCAEYTCKEIVAHFKKVYPITNNGFAKDTIAPYITFFNLMLNEMERDLAESKANFTAPELDSTPYFVSDGGKF